MGFFSLFHSIFKSSSEERTSDSVSTTPADDIKTESDDDAFAMDSDRGHVISISDLPLKSESSVLDSRWPPFPRAVQVLSPKHLIDAQAELVRNLCSSIPLSDEEVERYLMPVVWNLACFVHLLPASAHHHHRGLGGLFGHSLETAMFAAQTAKNKIFDYKARPEDAYMNKARWILACALSGLTHDVGKAVLDIRVYSDKGTWHPTMGSITEWCRASGVSAYYVSMNEDRKHKKHEQASLAYARVIIPRRTYLYLSQTGNLKIEEELHAAINGQREGCLVGEILCEADQLSVKLDERRQGAIDPREKLVTTPLADAIVEAMHILIEEGTWTVNEEDAHVWLTTQGCFIHWADVSDIIKVLAVEGVKGVPHDNSAMAGMLLTEGLIEAAPGSVSTDERFWPVCPLLLREGTLTCIKFRVPIRLVGSVSDYSPLPVYVPNHPMLEEDAKAWQKAYGFDPSAQESQQIEEEDFLKQLVESVAESPASYQMSLEDAYATDAEGRPLDASLFLPEEESDVGEPPGYITDVYTAFYPGDMCPEEDDSQSVHSQSLDVRASTLIEAKGNESPASSQDAPRSEMAPGKGKKRKTQTRDTENAATTLVVDAQPKLRVKKEVPSKVVTASPGKVMYVSSQDVELPKSPEEYSTLDVSEAGFALLLPGGVRQIDKRQQMVTATKAREPEDGRRSVEEKDRSAASGQTVQTKGTKASHPSPSPIKENRGQTPIDSKLPSTRRGTRLPKAEPDYEEDEFGGMVVDEEDDVVDGVNDTTGYDIPHAEPKQNASSKQGGAVAKQGDDRARSNPASSPAREKTVDTPKVRNALPDVQKKGGPLSTSTVERIAQQCVNQPRQAAKALMQEMKKQMLNRRGDLLSNQVWKNVLGFVTEDKAFKAALEALQIPVPLMAMELTKYQPFPKLEWDRENAKVHLKVDPNVIVQTPNPN